MQMQVRLLFVVLATLNFNAAQAILLVPVVDGTVQLTNADSSPVISTFAGAQVFSADSFGGFIGSGVAEFDIQTLGFGAPISSATLTFSHLGEASSLQGRIVTSGVNDATADGLLTTDDRSSLSELQGAGAILDSSSPSATIMPGLLQVVSVDVTSFVSDLLIANSDFAAFRFNLLNEGIRPQGAFLSNFQLDIRQTVSQSIPEPGTIALLSLAVLGCRTRRTSAQVALD